MDPTFNIEACNIKSINIVYIRDHNACTDMTYDDNIACIWVSAKYIPNHGNVCKYTDTDNREWVVYVFLQTYIILNA